MQAQNASERKNSKKGRQYPTPPTGSKASGLGITKEFINFLLDQDEANLCTSTHRSQKKDTKDTDMMGRPEPAAFSTKAHAAPSAQKRARRVNSYDRPLQ